MPAEHSVRKDRAIGALAITFAICAAFYLWTAGAFHRPWVQRGGDAFFAMQADAFLHRQTSLLLQPRPEMLRPPNPYDPAQNFRYRLYDASYYNGKYYLYWGVSPTLLWYFPVRALTGLDACDVGACSIFSIRPELRLFSVALLAAALVCFAFDLCFYGPTMRYEIDFLPALLLPAVTLVLWLDRTLLFRVGLPVLVVYSVVLSAAMSISGNSDGLLGTDPRQFNALARFFSPVERLLGPDAKSFGAVLAKVTPPACDSDIGQPLVATGIPGEGDVFSLHCAGEPGNFVVVWDHHWLNGQKQGSPFAVPLGQPMVVQIETPALYPRQPWEADVVFFRGAWDRISKACVVRVNGREVFLQDACEMDSSSAKTTYLFVNGIGIPNCAKRYSGDVLSVERIAPQ